MHPLKLAERDRRGATVMATHGRDHAPPQRTVLVLAVTPITELR
jgi:hypothetical protein